MKCIETNSDSIILKGKHVENLKEESEKSAMALRIYALVGSLLGVVSSSLTDVGNIAQVLVVYLLFIIVIHLAYKYVTSYIVGKAKLKKYKHANTLVIHENRLYNYLPPTLSRDWGSIKLSKIKSIKMNSRGLEKVEIEYRRLFLLRKLDLYIKTADHITKDKLQKICEEKDILFESFK